MKKFSDWFDLVSYKQEVMPKTEAEVGLKKIYQLPEFELIQKPKVFYFNVIIPMCPPLEFTYIYCLKTYGNDSNWGDQCLFFPKTGEVRKKENIRKFARIFARFGRT